MPFTRLASRTRDICIAVHGEKCPADAGLSVGVFAAMVVLALALVYGAVFIRRENIRPLLHRFGPTLAVVAGALVVWVAFAWP